MKTLKSLLLIIICTLLFSCNNDDDDYKFNAEYLKQTKWKGDFKEYYNGVNTGNAAVGIVFYNETEAEYDVKAENASKPTNAHFEYSIEDRFLIIPGGFLGGRWLVVQADKNKMRLETGTGADDGYKRVMNLTRIN